MILTTNQSERFDSRKRQKTLPLAFKTEEKASNNVPREQIYQYRIFILKYMIGEKAVKKVLMLTP